MRPTPTLETIADLVRRAGAEVLKIEREGITRDRKADRTIVTNADHAADRVLREGLAKAFPDIPILSEESGLHAVESTARFWAVDPLDGTKAFARGDAGFAVMVGLVEAGRPVAGAVYDPRRDELFLGAEGWGVARSLGGAPLAPANRPARSGPPRLVVTSSMPDAEAERLAAALGAEAPPHKVHSVGVKVGLLVSGAYDVYANTHPVSVWDLAAPAAVLAAAGGTFTDVEGRPLDLSPTTERVAGGTLATLGVDHAAVLAALRRVGFGPAPARATI